MHKKDKVPHMDDSYDCHCVACESFRKDRITIGLLVCPANFRNGCCIWKLNTWPETGWGIRAHQRGVHQGIVIGTIKNNDKLSGGHLDCVILFTSNGIWVTSKKWLNVL